VQASDGFDLNGLQECRAGFGVFRKADGSDAAEDELLMLDDIEGDFVGADGDDEGRLALGLTGDQRMAERADGQAVEFESGLFGNRSIEIENVFLDGADEHFKALFGGSAFGTGRLDDTQNFEIDDRFFEAKREIFGDLKVDDGSEFTSIRNHGRLQRTKNNHAARKSKNDVLAFDLRFFERRAERCRIVLLFGRNGQRRLGCAGNPSARGPDDTERCALDIEHSRVRTFAQGHDFGRAGIRFVLAFEHRSFHQGLAKRMAAQVSSDRGGK
jgi:hypothetical protein